ncbi:TonB-dependent receptor [Marinagarivorans algicola]|uniref:TonB-dependent receptor n=1 Tax=Marinagarivorans algicola TaxID=1513270 RepID=UPI000A75A906|nr:TonB-dependent receptor [Marinagarivorans algicola]
MKKKLLSLCITSLTLNLASHNTAAEEAVIYVAGADVNTLSATINDELYFFDESGIAVLDLPAGQYNAFLKEGNKALGQITLDIAQFKHSEVKIQHSADGLQVEQEQFSPDTDAQTGQLIGRIFSAGGESELAGAKVRVEGFDAMAVTDASGAYALNLPRGRYTVMVAHPEYAERKIEDLRIISGVATEASLSLAKVSAGVMEEVLILGVRGTVNESALAIERDASSIVSAITAEDFKKFGDSSASDVLKRVTGVSVVGGKFAVVRGLDGRYVSTTLDGGILPSTDPLRRDVPLDLFPSSVLQGINIGKSYAPKLPGTSTGGHVGMALKNQPTAYINTLSFDVKYNTETTGEEVLTYQGGGADWTGFDDGARALPAVINTVTRFGADELSECNPPPFRTPDCDEPEYLAELGKAMPTDFSVQDKTAQPAYKLAYTLGNAFDLPFAEFGVQGTLDYEQQWEHRDEFRLSYQSDDGSNFTEAEKTRVMQSDFNVDLTGFVVAGLTWDAGHTLTSKTLLLRKTQDTTRVTHKNDIQDEKQFIDTTLQWVERQLFNQSFDGLVALDAINGELNYRLSYGNTQRSEPDRRTYSYENGSVPDSQIFRTYSELDEDSLSASFDYQQEATGVLGSEAVYRMGALVSAKERDVKIGRFGYRFNDPDLDRTQRLEDLLSVQNFDSHAVKITTSNLKNDWYKATDDVMAAYASAEFNWADQWILALGGRQESLDIYLESTGPDADAPAVKKEENVFLPAMNVTWLQSDELQWRLGLSQTVLAPGLVEINSSSQFSSDGILIIGNADLEFSDIQNADFRGQYYWDDEQSFSLGVFYKNIEAPIEKSIVDGIPIDRAYTFRQSTSAEVLGLEIDILRNIADTSDFMFSYGINFSYIDSQVSLNADSARLEGRNERPLQGQSEYLGNFRVQAEHLNTHQKISLVGNYFDDRIDVVNSAASGDRIEQGRMVLDLIYSWEATDHLDVGIKIQNILDESVVYSMNGDLQNAQESYKKGIDIKVNASYRF